MDNIYEASQRNKIKSTILVILFLLFSALVIYVIINAIGIYLGYEPGGLSYLGIALIFSGVSTYVSYYYSDRIILKISGARPADRNKEFNFYTISENIALATGMPRPKLYVIEDTAPNAFATGRNPVVCATTGLLSKLNRTELEGVIAHEFSHIKNYDIRLMSLVSVLVGTIALLADWFLRMDLHARRGDKKSGQLDMLFMVLGILFAIVSPIIAKVIQLAISRRREFAADASSVAITRQPNGLMSALKKIAEDHEPLEAANKATAHLYIENPFKERIGGARGIFSNLFNTHPPVEKRIEALSKMI